VPPDLRDAWSYNADTGVLIQGQGRYDARFAPWWPKGFNNIAVTYTGGYATIPPAVKRATILWARHLYDATKRTGVLQSEGIGAYSYALAGPATLAAPPAAAALLSTFVRDWMV
jgi:hypothetical protein